MDKKAQQAEAKRIGGRIAWAREANGFTPQQLAEAVGIDPSMVRYIERGDRVPSLYLAMSLMHVLRVTPQYLLWGVVDEAVDTKLAARLLRAHPLLKQRIPERYSATPFPGKTGRSPGKNDQSRRVA